eukprot:scaffold36827_cov66-Phaeocystis_antarctica.AAC.1
MPAARGRRVGKRLVEFRFVRCANYCPAVGSLSARCVLGAQTALTPLTSTACTQHSAVALAERHRPPPEARMVVEEMTCRLCFGEADDGPPVQPCACRGSAKWIHKHRLKKWRRTSPKEDAAYRCGQQPVKTASLAIDQLQLVVTLTGFWDSCTHVPKATTPRVRKNSAELDMPPRLTRQRTSDTPLLMLATPPPVQRTGLSKDMGTVSVTPPTDTRICSKLEARSPVALPPKSYPLDPAPVLHLALNALAPLTQAEIQGVASKLPMAARAAAARAAAGRTAASLEAAAGRAAAGG